MTRPSCFVVYVVAIIRLVYVATWKVDFKKNNYNSFQEDDATSLFSIVMEIILTTVERLTSNVRRVELKFAKSTLLQVHTYGVPIDGWPTCQSTLFERPP